MAPNFPGKKFLSGTDAKSRVLLLLAGFIGLGVLIYLGVLFFGNGGKTTGPSRVANTPRGLESVPGGQLTPEYYRAVTAASAEAARQAQITGTSAIPTITNTPNQPGGGNCTILCPSDENANVADDLSSMVKAGKLSQKEADMLADLAKRNVSVDEYAAALDQLVREGKLTPEQARALLEKYKKQHQNALLQESAAGMDAFIKNGKLPLDTANELLELQKRKLTPAEYAAELARLVREGKLSPEAAAALLAQYTQQYQKEKAKAAAEALKQMARNGQITPDVAKGLQDLIDKNVGLDQYGNTLNKLVGDGKLTPAGAQKLLDQYKELRMGLGKSGLLGSMLAKGGPFANEANRLLGLQANNASLGDFGNELKQAVIAGLLSPDEAAALMREYQAMTTPVSPGVIPVVQTNIPTTDDFAKLATRVQGQVPPTTTTPPSNVQAQQFAAAAAQAEAEAAAAAEQARLERIQQLQAAMLGQAQSLVVAWQAPVMQHKEGTPESENKGILAGGPGGTPGGVPPAPLGTPGAIKGAPIIKAGTIYFAVLETAVDSDYPDTPVMATIVDGPFKGAKLIGKLELAQGMDKVSLNFTQMDMESWPSTKTVSAFALDPTTARTVMASDVDHHYLERYGAIMAAAFVTGYSSAITNEGTSTTGIFGTSSTHAALSPGNKLAVGIGQIGTSLSSTFQTWINRPTTVKITSGVGLGILFTTEVV